MDPNQDRKGKGPMIEPSHEEIIQARLQALGGVTIRGDQPASRPMSRPLPQSPRVSSSSTSHEVAFPAITSKSAGPMEIASVITSQDLRNLRARFGIPNNIRLSTALPEDRVTSMQPGKVALYEEFFKCGLRLPLHPFFMNLLNRYHLTPAQLTPNSVRIIFSFLVLCHFHGASARLSLFRALYRIRNPIRDGWWSFASRPKRVLRLNLPSKIKGWKSRFFYAHLEGVDTNWGVPDTSSNQNSNIEERDQELFNVLVSTIVPPSKELLSEDNLREIVLMPVSLPTAPGEP